MFAVGDIAELRNIKGLSFRFVSCTILPSLDLDISTIGVLMQCAVLKI